MLSLQKNSESKHLEGQKALDERHFCSVLYTKIMSPNTSFSTLLTQVDKHLDPFVAGRPKYMCRQKDSVLQRC